MACTGRAPSKRCQNVSVPDGACAELSLRTRRPHIDSMSQNSVKPTFPDFRTFRTPHTRTRSSFLNPAYIYMEIMMKKNTTRKEGLRGGFVRAHMCGVRNVRKSANPRKTYACALLTVCGGRVRTQRPAHTPSPWPSPCPPYFRPRKKGIFFLLACLPARCYPPQRKAL